MSVVQRRRMLCSPFDQRRHNFTSLDKCHQWHRSPHQQPHLGRQWLLDNLLFAAEIDGSTSFANINADGESTVVWGYLSTTSGTLGTLFTPDLPSATDVTLVDVILASAVLSDFAYFVVLQTSSDSIFLELDVDLQVTTEFQM